MRFHSQANVLVSGKPMILRKNEFPAVTTEIYFDVESDPTNDINYLLGVLIREKGKNPQYRYFFAQDKQDEARMWREFLDFLDSLTAQKDGGDDFVLYHYSYFERQVFSDLSKDYGISPELERAFNDHAIDLARVVTESAILPLY